jgi:hypothetical protein
MFLTVAQKRTIRFVIFAGWTQNPYFKTMLKWAGVIPIDKSGADLLFQIFSQRYEQGSLLITTNQPYKQWAKIFNNDTTITSAVTEVNCRKSSTI